MKTYRIRYGKDTLFSQAEKQRRIGAWVGDAVSVMVKILFSRKRRNSAASAHGWAMPYPLEKEE